MVTGNLALTCIFSTQGEIGEPGQKGSKGDKGENVSSLHCGEGVSSLIHLPGHVTIVTFSWSTSLSWSLFYCEFK